MDEHFKNLEGLADYLKVFFHNEAAEKAFAQPTPPPFEEPPEGATTTQQRNWEAKKAKWRRPVDVVEEMRLKLLGLEPKQNEPEYAEHVKTYALAQAYEIRAFVAKIIFVLVGRIAKSVAMVQATSLRDIRCAFLRQRSEALTVTKMEDQLLSAKSMLVWFFRTFYVDDEMPRVQKFKKFGNKANFSSVGGNKFEPGTIVGEYEQSGKAALGVIIQMLTANGDQMARDIAKMALDIALFQGPHKDAVAYIEYYAPAIDIYAGNKSSSERALLTPFLYGRIVWPEQLFEHREEVKAKRRQGAHPQQEDEQLEAKRATEKQELLRAREKMLGLYELSDKCVRAAATFLPSTNEDDLSAVCSDSQILPGSVEYHTLNAIYQLRNFTPYNSMYTIPFKSSVPGKGFVENEDDRYYNGKRERDPLEYEASNMARLQNFNAVTKHEKEKTLRFGAGPSLLLCGYVAPVCCEHLLFGHAHDRLEQIKMAGLKLDKEESMLHQMIEGASQGIWYAMPATPFFRALKKIVEFEHGGQQACAEIIQASCLPGGWDEALYRYFVGSMGNGNLANVPERAFPYVRAERMRQDGMSVSHSILQLLHADLNMPLVAAPYPFRTLGELLQQARGYAKDPFITPYQAQQRAVEPGRIPDMQLALESFEDYITDVIPREQYAAWVELWIGAYFAPGVSRQILDSNTSLMLRAEREQYEKRAKKQKSFTYDTFAYNNEEQFPGGTDRGKVVSRREYCKSAIRFAWRLCGLCEQVAKELTEKLNQEVEKEVLPQKAGTPADKRLREETKEDEEEHLRRRRQMALALSHTEAGDAQDRISKTFNGT